jgi:hypothetical protein
VAHVQNRGNEPREQSSTEGAANMPVLVGIAELTVAHLGRRGSSEAHANGHGDGCNSDESAATHLQTLFSHADCDRDRTSGGLSQKLRRSRLTGSPDISGALNQC